MNAASCRRHWTFTSRSDFETRMAAADAAWKRKTDARQAASAWTPRFKPGDVITADAATVRIGNAVGRFASRPTGTWSMRVDGPLTVRVIGRCMSHPGYMVEIIERDSLGLSEHQYVDSAYVAPRAARALYEADLVARALGTGGYTAPDSAAVSTDAGVARLPRQQGDVA